MIGVFADDGTASLYRDIRWDQVQSDDVGYTDAPNEIQLGIRHQEVKLAKTDKNLEYRIKITNNDAVSRTVCLIIFDTTTTMLEVYFTDS